MSVIQVSSKNFEKEVMGASLKVLLDFYADRCPSCRSISPIIDQIAEERRDIKVCKVNVDEEEELSRKFNVSSIPALFVMKNGEILKKSVGAKPKSQILDML